MNTQKRICKTSEIPYKGQNDAIRLDFFRNLAMLTPKERLRAFLLYRLAPVVDGAKPAELITLCPGLFNLYGAWAKEGNEIVTDMGLECRAMKERGDCACILAYDRGSLSRYLDPNWGRPILRDAGYRAFEPGNYLDRLATRFKDQCPHEIGLFLGFPYDDVAGFIENDGRNYLINGYWKVYSKPDHARATFRKYDAARLRAIA
jgi:hypothetical protein